MTLSSSLLRKDTKARPTSTVAHSLVERVRVRLPYRRSRRDAKGRPSFWVRQRRNTHADILLFVPTYRYCLSAFRSFRLFLLSGFNLIFLIYSSFYLSSFLNGCLYGLLAVVAHRKTASLEKRDRSNSCCYRYLSINRRLLDSYSDAYTSPHVKNPLRPLNMPGSNKFYSSY